MIERKTICRKGQLCESYENNGFFWTDIRKDAKNKKRGQTDRHTDSLYSITFPDRAMNMGQPVRGELAMNCIR